MQGGHKRTPEQIIGRDRVLQLDFEGYEVALIGTVGTVDEIHWQAWSALQATAVDMASSLDVHTVFANLERARGALAEIMRLSCPPIEAAECNAIIEELRAPEDTPERINTDYAAQRMKRTEPPDREVIRKALDFARTHLRPMGHPEFERDLRDFLRNASNTTETTKE